MRPSFAFLVVAVIGCTHDFDALDVSGAGGGATAAASSGAATTGAGGDPSSATASSGEPPSSGAGGTAPNVIDGGTAGGHAGGSGEGGAPPAPPACADQYGVAAIQMCTESPSECAFNFANSVESCAELCHAHGGECVEMYLDSVRDPCKWDPTSPQGCGTVGWSDSICVCSRGCGGSSACIAPALCQSGQCQ